MPPQSWEEQKNGSSLDEAAEIFWRANPDGVPLTALFGHKGGAGEVGARLKSLDKTGDGYLDKNEFRSGIEAELASLKSAKRLRQVVFVLSIFGFLLIGAITGLTYVVVDLSRETSVNTDTGVMTVRRSDHETLNGTSVDMLVRTGATELEQMKLSSCMPDSYFKELKQFSVESGLMKIAIEVQGYARLIRLKSTFGTVVALITPLGRITLDGQAIEFENDVGNIFAEAGFIVDASGRRLHGLYELSAFFNSVPTENFECFDEATDGTKPRFPHRYAANVSVLYNCDPLAVDLESHPEGPDRCAGILSAGLIERTMYGENMKFAAGHGKVYVDLESKISREEFYYPGRMENYGLLRLIKVVDGDKYIDNVEIPRNPTTGEFNFSEGYYCDNRRGIGSGELLLLPEEAHIAFEGEHVSPRGKTARSFTYYVHHEDGGRSQDYLYRFKDAWREAVGDPETDDDYVPAEYVMYQIELWDASKNIMLMMYELHDIDSSWRNSPNSGIMDIPKICNVYPVDHGPQLTQAEFLGTPLPFPDADIQKIETILYDVKTKDAMISNGNTGEYETVMEADGTKRRRRLQTTTGSSSAGRFPSFNAGGRRLQGYSCCKYYYEDQKTGIANSFSVAGGGSPIDVSVDFGFVLPIGQEEDSNAFFSTIPAAAMICAVEVAVKIELTGIIYVEGAVYLDWKAPGLFLECFEAGGCVRIGVGIKKMGIEITLLEGELCFSGGRYEVNGCMRAFLAISIGAGVSLLADTNIGKFGVEVSGTLFFKFFLPNDGCENIVDGVDEGWKANQLDFDPYFQLDWAVCFFFCYVDGWAVHILGPEPGRMLKKYHNKNVDSELADGIFDGISVVRWDEPEHDKLNLKAGYMTTNMPLAGFYRSESTSGQARDGDLANLDGGVQIDFAPGLDLWKSKADLISQNIESYDCRTIGINFDGETWAQCGTDEWAFGFRRKSRQILKEVERDHPTETECNCAITRRCDQQNGRCRWAPKKYIAYEHDGWDHAIDLIDGWKCCKVRVPELNKRIVPTNCAEKNVRDDMKRSEGYAICDNADSDATPKAMTGVYRDRVKLLGVACGKHELGCMERIKCCDAQVV